MVMSL